MCNAQVEEKYQTELSKKYLANFSNAKSTEKKYKNSLKMERGI